MYGTLNSCCNHNWGKAIPTKSLDMGYESIIFIMFTCGGRLWDSIVAVCESNILNCNEDMRGEGWGGGSLGDFPLMQRMFGRSLAKHRHLGKKHKHGSSQDGRAFFGDQWELLHVCINVKCQVLGCVRSVLETKGRFTL